jgi:hypothetical protein
MRGGLSWIIERPQQRSVMSISELVDLVKPPNTLIERGEPALWQAVQSDLGLRLPNDYYEYGLAYGSGSMANGFMLLFNWAAPHYRDYIGMETKVIRDAGTSLSRQVKVFPETPGLFPWGRDENGSSFCWLTTGDPVDWSVVIQSRDGKEFHYSLSMTTFLVNIFLNRLRCPVWHEPFTAEELNFRPSPQ